MTTLYVAEFSELFQSGAGQGAMARQPALVEQTLAIGAGSIASAGFGPATRYVRVHADSVCSIKFGSAPTAVATTARFAAGQTEYFAVVPGMKVAVITNT